MTTVTWNKTPRTVVSSQSVSASGTVRGTVDQRTTGGGVLTLKITNGAIGPTTPCEARVMIAHDSGATPAAGAAGAVWKTIRVYVGSVANNAVREFSMTDFPIGAMHLQVEFTGNTGQAVTVEAFFSEVTSASGA